MTTLTSYCLRLLLLGSIWWAGIGVANAQSYTFTTIAGRAGVFGTNDGAGSAALFYKPGGLAVDNAGRLYVADLLNHTIRKIAPEGTNWVVSTLAGRAGTLGSADGTNDQARFNRPSAVAVDKAGNLFVADNYNQTIRKLTPVGTDWVVTTVAGSAGAAGSDDGTNGEARFKGPQAIALDGEGKLYVTDRLNCTVREVSPADTNWVVSTLAGTAITLYGGFVDGANGDAEFNLPFGIARDNGGNLYVADFGNNAIRKISPIGLDWVTTTIAGFTGTTGTNDGPGSEAKFNSPNGIVMDAAETLYVADQYSHTIRKVEPAGGTWVVSTVAGMPRVSGTNDGAGLSVRFNLPGGLAIDSAGNLFVADSGSHSIRRGILKAATLPALNILLGTDQLVLSWPVTASNYVLEASHNLGQGAPWAAVTNAVALSGDAYVLTNAVGSGPAFFRLRRQ